MTNYGGFWVRVVAYLIDAILLFIVQLILGALLGVSVFASAGLGGEAADTAAGTAGLLYNLLSFAIGIAYFVYMESSAHQATFGKKALGLVVTDEAGQRISVLRAVGRYFAKFLSAIILLIGFIMVAFTDRKQGLHDMICSTLVLKGTPGQVSTDPSVFS